MTVGELKKMLEGVPDSCPVKVDVAADDIYEYTSWLARHYDDLKVFFISVSDA